MTSSFSSIQIQLKIIQVDTDNGKVNNFTKILPLLKRKPVVFSLVINITVTWFSLCYRIFSKYTSVKGICETVKETRLSFMYHMEETIQQSGKLGIYSLQDLTVNSVFMLTKKSRPCRGNNSHLSFPLERALLN